MGQKYNEKGFLIDTLSILTGVLVWWFWHTLADIRQSLKHSCFHSRCQSFEKSSVYQNISHECASLVTYEKKSMPLIRVTEELFWKGSHKPIQRIEDSYSLHKSWWLLCCLTFSTTQNQRLSQHPSPPLHKQQDTKFTAVRKITQIYFWFKYTVFSSSHENWHTSSSEEKFLAPPELLL